MPQRDDYRLREVTETDLPLILEWRNSERIRQAMFTGHVISMPEHRAWFAKLKNSSDSVYLVFEHRARPVGMVYFTAIDRYHAKCFWGFYLGETAIPEGSGTALGFLGLEHGFETLEMRKIIGETLASNEKSIRFHKKFGFTQEAHFVRHVLKEGRYEDVLSLALFADDWHRTKTRLQERLFLPEVAL